MSTSDQPDTPPLTRRQLREIRNTGSTPIIGTEDAAPEEAAAPAPAPRPRAADPAPVAPAPVEPVDLGVSPLTRRQARQQERIRTASVPVITPDLAPSGVPVSAVITDVPQRDAETATSSDADESPTAASRDAEPESEAAVPASGDSAEAEAPEHAEAPEEESSSAVEQDEDPAPSLKDVGIDVIEEAPAAQLNPALGSDLLAGGAPAAALPPSFDQLIARNASSAGSATASNALILSQTPAGAPLVGPVTATGEVLITGTFELPDGLGSVGHAPGAHDGKDLDVALIDGELPAASSPTPIAASAAISTVRNSGEEIIRPPAPEKGSRLMLALVITAGVLALALAGVLILAITTGRI